MKNATPALDWNRPRAMSEAVCDLMEEYDAAFARIEPVAVPTGFADLDWATSGLRPGSLAVVAGRPSLGKTSFALDIAAHVALEQKLPVLLFSMDMSSKQIAARLVCQTGRVDSHGFRTGQLAPDARERAAAAIEKLKSADLHIDETPALKASDIIARTREVFDAHGRLGLVVIDHLQIMNLLHSGEPVAQDYYKAMFALRVLAKEIQAPIVMLSQLGRRMEKRKSKRPRSSDLPSEAILQNADLLLLLYRDEVYDPESVDKGIAEIIIGRNRHGPVGTVRLRFVGEYGCFSAIQAADVDPAWVRNEQYES